MESVDITKLNLRDLRAMAKEKFGLTLPANASEEMIREAILDVERAKPKAKKPTGYKIIVHKSPVRGGDRDVPVIVNGTTYLLKRGVEIPAPPCVVEVLRNAIETRYEQRTDDRGMTELVAYQAQSYPFSILDAVFTDEPLAA